MDSLGVFKIIWIGSPWDRGTSYFRLHQNSRVCWEDDLSLLKSSAIETKFVLVRSPNPELALMWEKSVSQKASLFCLMCLLAVKNPARLLAWPVWVSPKNQRGH